MNSFHPVSLIRRAFDTALQAKSVFDIEVGDRYLETEGGVSVWVVKRISDVDMSEFPLISLTREDYPELTKTVSLSVLREKEGFVKALQ
ncbi:hypothetical protein KFE96_11790 [Kordiimonas sp. SCSIO 12603]|uniref:hypothetical protein n=1 Tax=Kordiimonas sp. SCSIO 12603 TaxID=2829596 RepID=UPI002102E3AE|nr:hypothetical protein [Kordiimonas sp. SCSIO 12603]UTW57521.1 hypothetical protein KFE96_11790 [Kordiimonas sp. SCSIO 12603]